ncbi:hypothetical protein FHG87_025264 [Trinorchestia longiramus]|nr:hypothetical protein FHG87_025264 [Trinorchestia longiramus]
MACYIQVCEEEGAESMELPLESDGTLLLTTLAAQFPGACGLKFRHSETHTLRGVRLVDDRLVPPEDGWGCVFICSYPKGN